MKKRFNFATMPTIAVLLLAGTSCSDTENEGLTTNETEMHAISVQTRSSENEDTIDWPLTLYAFNTSGSLTTSTTASKGENANLELGKGTYTLVALAGKSSLTIPENPKLTDDIGIPQNGIMTTAPQMATDTINVASDDINKNMTLSYPVAKIRISLTDLPTNVSSATVTLSPLFSSINFKGETSGSASPTLTLTKQDDNSWASETTYVLPSSDNLMLTVITNDETYTYSSSTKLEAGKSYSINGAYKGDVTVTVTFGIKSWETGGDINFDMTGEPNNT